MDYDITAESLDGTPATCTREFRSKPAPTISPPVHHSYKAIFCTWKSFLSWIKDIISHDREHGTPLYFIDTCFADVQFHENMIRILASTFLELKRQHPDEIRNLCLRNLHDSKRFRRIPFLWPFIGYFPSVSSRQEVKNLEVDR